MNEYLNAIVYRKPQFKLVPLRDAPVSASHQTICLHNGKIYVAGGLGPSATSTTNFTVYDIATDTWTTLAALPLAARTASMGAYGTRIAHIGAFNQGPNTISGAIYSYNIGNNQWTLASNQMPTPRYEMAYETLPNGSNYMFGGYNGALQSISHKADVTTANPAFTSLAGMSPVIRASGSLYDGVRYVYAAGGLTADTSRLKFFLRYDITGNSWTTLADLPVTCTFVHMIIWGGAIYALVTNGEGVYANHLYRYDIATNAWSYVQPVAGEIHALTKCIVYNNEIYLIGGWNGTARHAKVSKLVRY